MAVCCSCYVITSLVRSLQDHVEELKQLLALAKHPKTVALLKRGLLEAGTTGTNGLPSAGTVVKSRPSRPASDKPCVPTVKISNFGL